MLKIKAVAIIMVVVITASACSSDTGRSGNAKVLFTITNRIGFLKVLDEAASTYARENGIDLTIMDAEDDYQKQINHIRQAKSQGYDAIVCNAVNPDVAALMVDYADGLPLIFVNKQIDESFYISNQVVYVGSDESYAGQLQAEYLKRYFSGTSNLDIVLFRGNPVDTAALYRSESAKNNLTDLGINLKVVFEDTARWSRVEAQRLFNVFLKTEQNFDAVICNNDEMAVGVVNALIENGIDPSTVPIVGIDAIPDALQAIEDGTIEFTVYQSAVGQANQSIEAAVLLGSGSDLSSMENLSEDGKYVWVPFEPVDKDNVAQYMK